jgi:hypothetical protein
MHFSLRSDGYVHSLECGDGVHSVSICHNSSNKKVASTIPYGRLIVPAKAISAPQLTYPVLIILKGLKFNCNVLQWKFHLQGLFRSYHTDGQCHPLPTPTPMTDAYKAGIYPSSP